jgi:predicted dehydrogenase
VTYTHSTIGKPAGCSTHRTSRRRFLQSVTAASLAMPTVIPARVLAAPGRPGANDRVIIGFIGTGGRSRQLMDHVPAEGRIVAICDSFRQRCLETLEQKQADWNTYQVYEEMFERENLDAVVVGTPDHARVLPCIHACQAGLDVYAEKPLTLTIGEGRTLVRFARKHQTVFQVGSQQRTMEMNRFACELVRTGGIGRIRAVAGICYTGPRDYDGLPAQPVPEGNDWDRWQGPTASRPFHHSLQFGWMAWRDYSGGEMTNWGAHGVDQIQWALGMCHTGPVEIWPITPGPHGKVGMRYRNGVVVKYELDRGPHGGGIFTGTIARSRSTATGSSPIHPTSSRPTAASSGRHLGRTGLDRQTAHPELDRLHQVACAAQRRRGDRTPLDHGLPSGEHRPAARAASPLGSGPRAIRGRRRSGYLSRPAAPQEVRTTEADVD